MLLKKFRLSLKILSYHKKEDINRTLMIRIKQMVAVPVPTFRDEKINHIDT